MLRQFIELGSLKSGCRAMVVIESDVLLLPFSFSEMTVTLFTGDVLDLLDMFLHNWAHRNKNDNKILQYMPIQIAKSGLI